MTQTTPIRVDATAAARRLQMSVGGLRRVTFRTDDEALALANACDLGLISDVFTRDLARAAYFAEQLETGVVNINEGPTYWQPQTPSGGYAGKRSGLGRLGGRYTLLELTQTKTIVTDIER